MDLGTLIDGRIQGRFKGPDGWQNTDEAHKPRQAGDSGTATRASDKYFTSETPPYILFHMSEV